jgi:hypothetical protein
MSSGRSIDRNRPIYLYTHEKPTENPAVSFRHGCRRVVTENGSADKGKPLFRWLEISSWGRSFFTLVIAGAIVLTPGCTSSQEQARSQALDGPSESRRSSRFRRRHSRDDLVSGRAGKRLMYHQPVVASYELDGENLTWVSVFVATGQAGGGLTYQNWAARACIRYSGSPGAAKEITWQNTECPAGKSPRLDPGPIDETVRIEPE